MKFASCFVILLLSCAYLCGAAGDQMTPYWKYPSVQLVPLTLLNVSALKHEHIKESMRDVAEYQINKYGSKIKRRDWFISQEYLPYHCNRQRLRGFDEDERP